MGTKPAYRSMNFSIYEGALNWFKDKEDLRQYYETYDLNGLEVIRAGEPDQGKIAPDMVNGVHLYFHIFWMDWWLGHYDRLDEEFDSREQWIEYFGGMDRSSYLDSLRSDLEYAEEMGAKYVVFHVSEVTLRESYVYKYRYSNEEVIDAALDVINALMDEREYPFDFLVENLWWSGLDMKDVALTRRLVEGIHAERKGILLDTGHYMNTSDALATEEDALQYLNAMIDQYEEAGMLHWFKGMHLQLSLGGDYVKEQKKDWAAHPMNFDDVPFYELFRLAYEHACRIDLHQPFEKEGVREIVERLQPEYLTFELSMKSREEFAHFLDVQSKALGWR